MILLADHKAFLHEALDEDDPLLVFQLAWKLTDGKSRGLQSEIQRVAKEVREDNAPGAEVEADGILTGMRAVDHAAARPDDVVERERSRLEEVHNLTGNIERERFDHLIPELIHD